MLKWWGYIHVDGSIHVKRFFDFGDILEAQASDFVKSVTTPFEANSRLEAIEIYGDADLSLSQRLIDFVYEHGEGSMFKMQNPD